LCFRYFLQIKMIIRVNYESRYLGSKTRKLDYIFKAKNKNMI